MAWTSEPIENFFEIRYKKENCTNECKHSKKYVPGKYSSVISLELHKNDVEVLLKPFTIETLTQVVEKDYNNITLNKLIVGIRNETNIDYISKLWTSKESGKEHLDQYFFKQNQPSGFCFGDLSGVLSAGSSWPTNHAPILDSASLRYLKTLKRIRPEITNSLDKCCEYLLLPGPQYVASKSSKRSNLVLSQR